MATQRDVAQTAALLRRLLDLVDRGELDAGSAHGAAMVRRVEGAIVALEQSVLPARGRPGLTEHQDGC